MIRPTFPRFQRGAKIVLLFLFIGALLNSGTPSVQASSAKAKHVWVQTETQVNPLKVEREYYGGGQTPNYYSEPRFEGKHTIYRVTDASFSINDREVDHGYEYHNVIVETFFAKPPMEMVPGATVELHVGFSHSGTVAAEGTGVSVLFQYSSDDVHIDPDIAFGYAPWSPGFSGKTETLFEFVVPPASAGGELEIRAGLWNAAPCLVVWKYQAQEVKSDVVKIPTDERGDRELGDERCAEMQQEVADKVGMSRGASISDLKLGIIGKVVGQTGDTVQDYCVGGKGPLVKGSLIKIGDCIQTGPNGRVRMILNDRDDKRNAGPTAINISTNTEICIDHFSVHFDDPPARETTIELIRGSIREFLKGWRGESSFTIRTGNSICGIRGSDVLVNYHPDTDVLAAMVFEGEMDITVTTTGETINLGEHQGARVDQGTIINLGKITPELWETALENKGIRDEDFPDAVDEWSHTKEGTAANKGEEINEDEEEGNEDATGGDVEIAESPPPLTLSDTDSSSPIIGYLFVLCIGSLCLAGAAAAAVTVIVLVRRQSQS